MKVQEYTIWRKGNEYTYTHDTYILYEKRDI